MSATPPSAGKRQLKLGAVTYGTGGPGLPYLWLDEDIPADASVNTAAPWPSSAARSPGTTSVSTTSTPRSRSRPWCTPSAASAPARSTSPS
jgi:hypothetical protein